MEQTPAPHTPSPAWGTNTKLVIALTTVVITGALVVNFQFIITPLVMAFMLSYLFHPVAEFMQRKLHFSWSAAVSVIFLVVLFLLIGLLTLGGVGLMQQIQSLVVIVQDAMQALPQLMAEASGRVYQFGPFKIDFRALDLNDLSQQILGVVQPMLSRTGTLLGSAASGAANFLGWTLFVLLVAYFTLVESRGLRDQIITVNIPGYGDDFARLSRELGRIWNAFLRGQIILFFLTIVVYAITLGVLGVQYAIGLSLMAGLARFVPYVGPAVNWALLVIVAYFQNYSLFDLPDLTYASIILVVALLIDQVFDNILSPRIMSSALKVHPAAVLVAAIIAANLFGILGVVVAAPTLATASLLWKYIMRKMLDLDPFPEKEVTQPPPPPGSRLMVAMRRFLRERKPSSKK